MLCEDVEVGDEAEGEVAVDGAAVAEKETVTLSSAQNCLARFSAEGTFVLQLPTTQEYSESGNNLSRCDTRQSRVRSWRGSAGDVLGWAVTVDRGDTGAVRLCDRECETVDDCASRWVKKKFSWVVVDEETSETHRMVGNP